MKRVLTVAALLEAALGVALLIAPSMVVRLLLGDSLAGSASVAVARVTGMALMGLGVACWPGPPVIGLLTYSVIVTLFLAYLGSAVRMSGLLLWPAVGTHLVLIPLLIRVYMKGRPARSGP